MIEVPNWAKSAAQAINRGIFHEGMTDAAVERMARIIADHIPEVSLLGEGVFKRGQEGPDHECG